MDIAMNARSPLALLAALVLAAGGAVSVSGCGSAASTIDPVAKAADATEHAGGSQVAFKLSISAPGLESPLAMSGQGNFNFERSEGTLVFELKNLPSETLTALHTRSLRMTEVYKAGIGYVRSPLFEGKLPNGAHWLKIDMGKVLAAAGLSAGSLTSGGVNPAQYLQYLKAKGATLSVAGHERVHGVPTTRYSGTFDIVKASEGAPGANPALVKKTFEKLLPHGDGRNVPLSVWIDAHSLVRRMLLDIALEPAGQRTDTKLDMEFTGFGATPSVTVPPDSEVFDVTQKTIEAESAG